MPARRIDEPGLAASCALRAIRVYQRFLSPHKGFSCALRGATGADSCSTYGYRVIGRCGLRKGLRLLRRRLDACGRHHRFGGGPLQSQRGFCDPGCDAACDVGDVVSGACDVLGSCSKCGSCDLSSWGRSNKKPKVNDADFEALRTRVAEAKRRNAQGQ
jgi:putative component of membrane protein insertase Oxa1/YidC/SpoIIIJ protein YidD